jgi:23S rRNA pseudouridine2605 synthase
MTVMRLQRFLSQAGVASRRKAEELILKGAVSVNEVVVRELGTKIDSEVDRIRFRGKPLVQKSKFLYYLLHKPRGVVVTKRDPEGRKTVYQLIHHLDSSVNSVGRLDQDSEGLLLLTNDGELAFRLSHPSYEVEKVYHVLLNQLPSPAEIQKLKEGISLEEGITSPAKVQVIKKTPEIWLSLQIHEGKKRQVRRMLETVGCSVKRLIRVKIGPLEIENLPPGRWRLLSPKEVLNLKREVGLKD